MTDTLQSRLATALGHHRRGDVLRAANLYREILRGHPRSFDALLLLGVATADQGAVDAGIDLIRRAISVDPSQANAHFSLAQLLLARGESAAALEHLKRTTDLQPQHADAWFSQGNVLQQMARLDEAVAGYERALASRPEFPEACNNLSVALRALRRTLQALEYAERAVSLRPGYAQALNNRGLALLDERRGAEAVESFRAAIAAQANFPEALHNLGTALQQLGRFAQARDAFAQFLALAPGFKHAAGNLLHARLCGCDWTGHDEAVDEVIQAIERGGHADVPMSFLAACGSAAAQLRCARTYTEAFHPAQVQAPPPARRQESGGRIRLAYLSGDFGEHAVTYLLAGVFERHDRNRFETIALSWGRQRDGALRQRVQAAFERFVDVSTASDAEVARLMQELRVDIAVDLTGHTRGFRTGILARRAAGIQVNFLGLPATMGASYMDYIVADRFLIPPEQRIHYAERVVWLPEIYQPNDDRRRLVADGAPRSTHGLPRQAFVFCSFNSNFKFNPGCFDVWIGLLQQVPDSVLWLLAGSEEAEANLRREAALRGVDPKRLVFAKQVPYEQYLARYAHADLFLDTFPYNGGTTVSDALSMGVPVVTCVGESFAARMAGSILTHLGLGDLAARSPAEYSAVALDLARNPTGLRAVRQRLAELRSGHSFFDTDRYRRHLETAYRMMSERYRAGLAPEAFAVPAEPPAHSGG